jgi:hypothetical protein
MGLTAAQEKMIYEKAEIKTKTLMTLSLLVLEEQNASEKKTTIIIFLCMAVGRTCFQITVIHS